jgi:hypothetical protein
LDQPDFRCCPSCGLVWSSLSTEKLGEVITAYGDELLKQDLELGGAGPGHGLPDTPEAQRAAQAVAQIDSLVRERRLSEAAERYRDLTSTTAHHAGYVIRDWRSLGLALKLSLFGWQPKAKGPPDGAEIVGHPMRDSLLDG